MSNGAYTFKGKVVSVGKTECLGKDPKKPFRKRQIVIDGADEDDQYPNPVPFDAIGEKCTFLDPYRRGDLVELVFAMNGREWKDKEGKTRFFCSNKVLSIKKIEAHTEAFEDNGADDAEMPDDIPF